MTRRLAWLADIAYRRRGRMVLGWIVAAVVIIGIGGALAGEYNANYDTPGSESEAAGDLTKERFDGYSGQEINVVWKDGRGADSAAVRVMRGYITIRLALLISLPSSRCWSATGWASAGLAPMMISVLELRMSLKLLVMAP